MHERSWFRDLDARDVALGARARDGDSAALSELRRTYRELGEAWVNARSWAGDTATLLEQVDRVLVQLVLREAPSALHLRWLELIRREALRHQHGWSRSGCSAQP